MVELRTEHKADAGAKAFLQEGCDHSRRVDLGVTKQSDSRFISSTCSNTQRTKQGRWQHIRPSASKSERPDDLAACEQNHLPCHVTDTA
jgi:hypothetical protein